MECSKVFKNINVNNVLLILVAFEESIYDAQCLRIILGENLLFRLS